jgi:hypothetical protein
LQQNLHKKVDVISPPSAIPILVLWVNDGWTNFDIRLLWLPRR